MNGSAASKVQEGHVHVRVEVRHDDVLRVYEVEEPICEHRSAVQVTALRALGLVADELVKETA